MYKDTYAQHHPPPPPPFWAVPIFRLLFKRIASLSVSLRHKIQLPSKMGPVETLLETFTQSFPFFLRTFTFETPHSQLWSNFRLFLGCFLDCFFFLGFLLCFFFFGFLFFFHVFPLSGLFLFSTTIRIFPTRLEKTTSGLEKTTSGPRPRRPSDWREWLPFSSREEPGEQVPRRSRQQDTGSREEAGELLELPRSSRQQDIGSKAHCPLILLP